ncbi:MAG: CAP domain-containing protein [Chitinophagaceae bacterium]|nr:MAG: CAP domain-containing protein [Chitinophagaceae bacterium]
MVQILPVKSALIHLMKPSILRFIIFSSIILTTLVSFVPGTSGSAVNDVLVHTNEFRKSKGLSQLKLHEGLNAIAQKHSADMARKRVGFGHAGADRRNAQARREIPSLRYFAENVAYGVPTGKAAVTGWKKSPGHRRNLLGRYKYIGIGTAKDRQGRIYYTQVFAG